VKNQNRESAASICISTEACRAFSKWKMLPQCRLPNPSSWGSWVRDDPRIHDEKQDRIRLSWSGVPAKEPLERPELLGDVAGFLDLRYDVVVLKVLDSPLAGSGAEILQLKSNSPLRDVIDKSALEIDAGSDFRSTLVRAEESVWTIY
jgi:hypothetical protein